VLVVALRFGRTRPQTEGTPWVDGTVVHASSRGLIGNTFPL
jgi:hypothetical protein